MFPTRVAVGLRPPDGGDVLGLVNLPVGSETLCP